MGQGNLSETSSPGLTPGQGQLLHLGLVEMGGLGPHCCPLTLGADLALHLGFSCGPPPTQSFLESLSMHVEWVWLSEVLKNASSRGALENIPPNRRGGV